MKKLAELPWEANEKTVAEKYYNEKCGPLHLSWAMDRYWGLVTERVIMPNAIAIHEALVQKGHNEENVFDFASDDTTFFIPCKNRKVFVHTTQSRDYLYIVGSDFPELREDDLHIRRIYRQWKDSYYTAKECFGTVKRALQYADTLNEYSDDHYQYSHRPSLEAYRKVNFQIPYHPKDHMKEKSYYGDFRDGGYVLSYNGWMSKASGPRVEGSKYVFSDLEIIATCYLTCLADALELSTPRLDGYR